jgi:hypothetical protein
MATPDVMSFPGSFSHSGPSHRHGSSERRRGGGSGADYQAGPGRPPWELENNADATPARFSNTPRRTAPARFRTAQTRSLPHHHIDPRSSGAPGARYPQLQPNGSAFPRGPHVRDYSRVQQVQPGNESLDLGPRDANGYGPPARTGNYLPIEAFGFEQSTSSRIRKGMLLRESSREHKAFERHPTASSSAIEYMNTTLNRPRGGFASSLRSRGRGRGRGDFRGGRGGARGSRFDGSTSAAESSDQSSREAEEVTGGVVDEVFSQV